MQPTETTLQDRLDADYAPAWKPEPEGTLIGEIVELTERDGGYGSYPIVTVRQDDGQVLAAHAFHTVLAQQLAEHRPAIGERIGIKYKGKTRSSGERPVDYHAYVVRVDRLAGTSIDWARYGDGQQQAPPAAQQAPQHATGDPGPTPPASDDDIPF